VPDFGCLECIVSSVVMLQLAHRSVMLQLTHTSRAALPDASANPADFLLAWREGRQTRRPKGSLCLPARQATWAVLLYSVDRPDHSNRLLVLRPYGVGGVTVTVAEPLSG
jgi:hypothetical protein